MNSIVVNDERLRCIECGSTESRIALPKVQDDQVTESVCTGCGTYSVFELDEFDLFEKELTDFPT